MSVSAGGGDTVQRASREAAWVGEIGESDLIRRFGALTAARAREYARGGNIMTVVCTEHGATIVATVRGSERRRYQTLVRRGEDPRSPTTWRALCSCPVGHDCKHALAVLFALQDAVGTLEPRSWADVLDPLLRRPDPRAPRPADGPAGLAVGVTLTDPDPDRPWRSVTTRVEVEPLRAGRNRAYVRSGLTWQQLLAGEGDAVAGPADPQVQAAAAHIWGLHLRAPGSRVALERPRLDLAPLGSGVWSALGRLRDAGLPLLQDGDPAAPVELLATHTARVLVSRIDARGSGSLVPVPDGESDGGYALRVVARVPGGPDLDVDSLAGTEADAENTGPATQCVPVGAPPHALAVRRGPRLLALVPLDPDLHPALASLLLEHEPLTVPAADVGTFVTDYLRPLSAHVDVTASGPGVDLPELRPPRLLLTLRPRPGGLALHWGFVYGTGEHRLGVGLAARPGDAARDPDAELALLDRHAHLPGLGDQRRASRRGDATPLLLLGEAAARFVLDDLPTLREECGADLEVDVDGDLPDYHRAVGEPQVSVEIDEALTRDGVDWFDLRVRVEVDGERVPFRDLFTALTTGEASLLLESGTWFDLDRPCLTGLRQVIEEARALSDAAAPGQTPPEAADDADPGTGRLRLGTHDVDLWQHLLEDGVIARDTFGWAASVRRLTEAIDADPAPVPAGVRAVLRPYQRHGFTWLAARWDAGLGGILADDMGLGKTLQTLALVQRARDRGEVGGTAPPVLVVAPTSVVAAWAEQAALFTPDLRVVVIEGTKARRAGGPVPDDRGIAALAEGAHLVLTSYTLARLEAPEYQAITWAGVVLDEAQAVKNIRSRTYDAVRRLDARFRLVVTGTPVENSLLDLWAMLSLSVPGLFPRPERFGAVYRGPIESRGDTARLDRLRARIAPFVLRRTKDLVAADLPGKQEQVVHVPLAAAHARRYQQHLARERQKVLGLVEDLEQNRVAVLASITRLRLLSLDPRLDGRDHEAADAVAEGAGGAKLEVLADLVRELSAEGHRTLVFSSFTRFLRLAQDRLHAAGLETLYLDGSMPAAGRRAVIERFREGEAPAFLISLKAGGVGLTLTEADYVIVLDPWWNPAAEAQAVDRTHRIGQTRPVHVYRLVSTDTIEEKVLALQEHKRALAAAVLAPDDGNTDAAAPSGPRLSAEDIRELLS